tara:strand:+ start:421 stop:732 length:312 start_codon:yes stop_codon:yes gene_type:complete
MPITEDFDVFVQRYKGTNMEKVNCQKRRMDLKKEDLIRLTPENVRMYIGREIIFRTRGDFIFKTLKSVSKTGRTAYIDHPDLQNALQIVSRKVFVINDEPSVE